MTSLEYAIIAGIMVVAIIAGATQLGVNVGGLFDAAAQAFP